MLCHISQHLLRVSGLNFLAGHSLFLRGWWPLTLTTMRGSGTTWGMERLWIGWTNPLLPIRLALAASLGWTSSMLAWCQNHSKSLRQVMEWAGTRPLRRVFLRKSSLHRRAPQLSAWRVSASALMNDFMKWELHPGLQGEVTRVVDFSKIASTPCFLIFYFSVPSQEASFSGLYGFSIPVGINVGLHHPQVSIP